MTANGYYTIVKGSAGTSTGFTPSTFGTIIGDSYTVQVDNYGACSFSQWSNGVTNNPLSFTASGSAITFTAVYNCRTPSGISLVQQAVGTCTSVCSTGSESVTFASGVTSGHILVITVVSEDHTSLQVSDSLGTNISWQSSHWRQARQTSTGEG